MASWSDHDSDIYEQNEEALRSREREDFWRGVLYQPEPDYEEEDDGEDREDSA